MNERAVMSQKKHRTHDLSDTDVVWSPAMTLGEARVWWAMIVPRLRFTRLDACGIGVTALLGLAQIYQRLATDTCVAGLWKRTLLEDLC